MSGAAVGITVWMLVFYAGGHAGYITQGDLIDQSACHALAGQLTDVGAKPVGISNPWYRCVSYARAPR